MGMNAKRKLKSIRFHIGACALGFLMIYPLLWLLASSFKSNETMFLDTYSPVSYTHLDVYKRQIFTAGRGRLSIRRRTGGWCS